MKNLKKDNLYKKDHNKINKFIFNNDVANVFEDMVNRSVPGYEFLIDNIGVLSKKFYQQNTRIYDLGASLCACSLSILEKLDNTNVEIYAVDSSKAMIDICKKNINKDEIKFINSDILDIEIKNASVVILNLTLQFIPIDKREYLLNNIFSRLNKEGIVIITEKIKLEKEHDDIFLKISMIFLNKIMVIRKKKLIEKKLLFQK